MKENSAEKVNRRGFDLNQEVYLANLEDKRCYHPQIDTTSNCEQCGRSICASCSVIYPGDFILGVPDEELCFWCYNDKIRADRVFELLIYGVLLFGLISGLFGSISLIVKSLLF